MRCLTLLFLTASWTALVPVAAFGDQATTYPLTSDLQENIASQVKIELNVGGEILIQEEKQLKKMPLSVTAKLRYEERLLTWSARSTEMVRSLRHYDEASATIKVAENGIELSLPLDRRLLVAEINNGRGAINGLDHPLTREQLDLVNVVGNTLAIDQLLPGRAMAEGDRWDQEASAIGALLGMDHVAVCEVSSIVVGKAKKHIQIRMAGTVHGTIDGAATEIELRAAYIFHQRYRRITMFNMAIKEHRTAGEVAPGLDIVAKVKLEIAPVTKPHHGNDALANRAKDISQIDRELFYDGQQHGFQFQHDVSWYVTAKQTDLLSIRRLHNGDLTAHCNVTTLPARSAGRQTSLDQFERDIRESLGEHLDDVAAVTQWTTAQGHDCLGVIANGKVEGGPIQWRYYLVSDDDLPRVSIAVTVEQALVEQFADADRQIIDSLKLLGKQTDATATKQSEKAAR